MDVRVGDVLRALARLREDASAGGAPALRTSVMTHLAWAPPEWAAAATETLAGLGDRHPSRTVLLLPGPGPDGLDAEVALYSFEAEGLGRQVASEVVRLRLRGARAEAPASVVAPLLVSDLPVFLRWRGRPPFGEAPLEQLVGLADRLVVDSDEWPAAATAYPPLAGLLERAAVSDIAWARTLTARRALAGLWPGIRRLRELRVHGPEAQALLLAGWLRARLRRKVALAHEPAPALAFLAVDGEPVALAGDEPATPSDLLSRELDTFGRDRVYEGTLRATSPG